MKAITLFSKEVFSNEEDRNKFLGNFVNIFKYHEPPLLGQNFSQKKIIELIFTKDPPTIAQRNIFIHCLILLNIFFLF